MKIVTIVSSTSLEVERAADGSGSAGSYSNGAATVAIGASVTLAAELFKDSVNTDSEISVDDASVFATNQFLKIDSEFMDVTAVNTDTLGTSIIVLAEEKSARAFDGQSVKIRFLYSQGRFTGHDFLQVGTGGTTTTNWPGTPTRWIQYKHKKLLKISQVVFSMSLLTLTVTSVLVDTSRSTEQLVPQP